jgi:integrase/recombinase XerC
VHAGTSPEPAQLCNRAMFELLYSSGLRVSELAALDLQASPGAKAYCPNREVIVTGKGNKRAWCRSGRPRWTRCAPGWPCARPPATAATPCS